MSTDTSSTSSSQEGASNASTQTQGNTAKEDTMSTSTGSTTSSTPGSGGSNGSTSTTAGAASPEAEKEVKKKGGEKYMSKKESAGTELLIRDVTAKKLPVQAELDTTQRSYDAFLAARTGIRNALAVGAATRGARNAEIKGLKSRLRVAMLDLRLQKVEGKDGSSFAKGLRGKFDVQTAENVITQVPGSGFELTPQMLDGLRSQAQKVRDLEQKVAEVTAAENTAREAYDQTRTVMLAAATVLRATVTRLEFSARIPAASKPARGALKVAKSAAAHSKKKEG